MQFVIEYHSDLEMLASTPHPGPLAKAEREATIGLLRYLMAGVKTARIFDSEGHEVMTVVTPTVTGG